MVFNATSSYTMAVSFIGGGNWSTWRKPQPCRKEQKWPYKTGEFLKEV
jgi:hypothetical protein